MRNYTWIAWTLLLIVTKEALGGCGNKNDKHSKKKGNDTCWYELWYFWLIVALFLSGASVIVFFYCKQRAKNARAQHAGHRRNPQMFLPPPPPSYETPGCQPPPYHIAISVRLQEAPPTHNHRGSISESNQHSSGFGGPAAVSINNPTRPPYGERMEVEEVSSYPPRAESVPPPYSMADNDNEDDGEDENNNNNNSHQHHTHNHNHQMNGIYTISTPATYQTTPISYERRDSNNFFLYSTTVIQQPPPAYVPSSATTEPRQTQNTGNQSINNNNHATNLSSSSSSSTSTSSSLSRPSLASAQSNSIPASTLSALPSREIRQSHQQHNATHTSHPQTCHGNNLNNNNMTPPTLNQSVLLVNNEIQSTTTMEDDIEDDDEFEVITARDDESQRRINQSTYSIVSVTHPTTPLSQSALTTTPVSRFTSSAEGPSSSTSGLENHRGLRRNSKQSTHEINNNNTNNSETNSALSSANRRRSLDSARFTSNLSRKCSQDQTPSGINTNSRATRSHQQGESATNRRRSFPVGNRLPSRRSRVSPR